MLYSCRSIICVSEAIDTHRACDANGRCDAARPTVTFPVAELPPPLGWYSFPIPPMRGGWVGLSGLLHVETVGLSLYQRTTGDPCLLTSLIRPVSSYHIRPNRQGRIGLGLEAHAQPSSKCRLTAPQMKPTRLINGQMMADNDMTPESEHLKSSLEIFRKLWHL